MNKSTLAKIFGWGQFAVASFGQIGQIVSTNHPQGIWGWLPYVGSFLAAVAVHHASGTDGSK